MAWSSIGRWFESGSEDVFFSILADAHNYCFNTAGTTNNYQCVHTYFYCHTYYRYYTENNTNTSWRCLTTPQGPGPADAACAVTSVILSNKRCLNSPDHALLPSQFLFSTYSCFPSPRTHTTNTCLRHSQPQSWSYNYMYLHAYILTPIGLQ